MPPDTTAPVTDVAGRYMDRSLRAFAHACDHYIVKEREKLAPDNALVALLADGVRLTRELTAMQERLDAWIERELTVRGVPPYAP